MPARIVVVHDDPAFHECVTALQAAGYEVKSFVGSMEALDALRTSELYAYELGKPFVEYMLKIKGAEVARFLSEVTDWEHREYFEMF